MSAIELKDIDEWFFNYFEGNLSAGEKEQFIAFLHTHPFLKADHDAWKSSYIREPAMVYPGMDTLLIKNTPITGTQKSTIAILCLAAALTVYWLLSPRPTVTNLNEEPFKSNTNALPAATDSVCERPSSLKKRNTSERSPAIAADSLPAETVVSDTVNAEAIQQIIQQKDSLIPLNAAIPIKVSYPVSEDTSGIQKEPIKGKKKKKLKMIQLNNTGF